MSIAPTNPSDIRANGIAQPTAARQRDASLAYRLLGNLVLALALVGFPLAAAASELRGIESSDLNIAYRVAVTGFCGILIAWSAGRGRYRIDPLILFFFAIYSVRLILDFGDSRFPNIEDDGGFFAVTVLIPTLAMGGAKDWYDERMLLRLALVIGGLSAAMIALLLSSDLIQAQLQQQQQDRATLTFLNPITIGYHGLFIAMAGTVLLAKYRTRLWLAPSIAAIALGAYLMVAGGARGPFVALAVGLILTGAANRRANGAYVVGAIIAAAAIAWLGLPESVINRFLAVGIDESSLERVYAIDQSIDLALANPLFGYAYIEPVTGQYPHNLLIEAGLALGVAGFASMAWMQLSMAVNIWRHAQHGEWAVPFLAAAMIANAWISGAIWGSALFFMLLWLLRETPASRAADQGRLVPPKLAAR